MDRLVGPPARAAMPAAAGRWRGAHRLIPARRRSGPRRQRLARLLAGAAGGFRLDLADRFFQREPFAGDLRLIQRRHNAAQLRHQRRARPLIERAPVLAGVLVEPFDGAKDERVIVSHRAGVCHAQVSNGLCIRIVSSRSGLVDSSATGQPINSSIRRTYLTAAPGNWAHERAFAVTSLQPSAVS